MVAEEVGENTRSVVLGKRNLGISDNLEQAQSPPGHPCLGEVGVTNPYSTPIWGFCFQHQSLPPSTLLTGNRKTAEV